MVIIKSKARRRSLVSDSPPPTPESLINEPPDHGNTHQPDAIYGTTKRNPPVVTKRITKSQGRFKTTPMTKEEGPAIELSDDNESLSENSPQTKEKGHVESKKQGEDSNPLDTLVRDAKSVTSPKDVPTNTIADNTEKSGCSHGCYWRDFRAA